MTATRRSALIAVCAAGIVGQAAVPFVILIAWLRVYFVIEGPPPVPTPAQIIIAGVISGSSIAASVALIVIARVARARGFVIAHSVLLVVIVAFAAFFAVPRLDFSHHGDDYPLPSDYTPCYSGSNECN